MYDLYRCGQWRPGKYYTDPGDCSDPLALHTDFYEADGIGGADFGGCMRKLLLIGLLIALLAVPARAMEFTPPEVPESGEEYMPDETDSFGEGLWYVIKSAIASLQPSVAEAARVCLSLIASVLLISIINSFPGNTKFVLHLTGTVLIGVLLFSSANSLIRVGSDTVTEMAEYGKLLLPVMTAALAAQGAVTSSAALYAGTAMFSTVLTTAITKIIIPMLYIYLCLCVANSAVGEDMLKKLRDFIKWLITWSMKIILYVFTGYLAITGVVSGTADAATLKAVRLTISGMVPVVGGIISDASEAILVSAGVMKSAAGVYGILALIAVFIGPFLKIGLQYLILKLTASVCDLFGCKQESELIHDFSGGMGMILGMIGTVCLLLLISTVCFMKGVT